MDFLRRAQQCGLKIISQAESEPVDIDEAHWHLRLDPVGSTNSYEDDPWLNAVGLPAARSWCEGYMERSVAQRVLEMSMSGFPAAQSFHHMPRLRGTLERAYDADRLCAAPLALPLGPVRSIVSVKYVDAEGALQTVDPSVYELDDYSTPAILNLAFGKSWPTARSASNSVLIRYAVGYDTSTDGATVPLPFDMKSAILLVLGHLFENRENTAITRATDVQEIPLGAQSLLAPYVVRMAVA